MSYPMIEIGDLMLKRNGSVDPSKFPDETFELHSIPAFDKGTPDIVKGSEIRSSKQLVQENDVMISKIVPHIRRASVVCPKGDYRQIASGEWIVFRSDKIYPDYLKHVLISDTFNKHFMATVSGVGGSLLRARPAFVAKIKIALPPLAEQRRIASILDQADELRQKRQQAIEKLDQLLQATFIDMFGDPVSNPKGFPIQDLEFVALQVTDGTHHTPKRETSGIPLLSARNVLMGRIDFENIDFVGEEEYQRLRKRCEPLRGDILISCSGSIGRVSTVDTDRPFVMVRSAALVKLNKTLVTSKFIEYLLRTPYLQSQMIRSSKSSSQANLFQEPIKRLKILLPSLDLQGNFEKFVEVSTKEKEKLQQSSDKLETLFRSLQNQAFSGTL